MGDAGMTLLAGGASLLGGKLGSNSSGSATSSGPDIQAGITQMNNLLTTGLQQALSYNSDQTGKAVSQENTSLGNATNALNSGLTGATGAVNNALGTGLQQYKAAQSPYALAGYNALDRYMDSLGVSRPQSSAALAGALGNASQLDPSLISNLQSAAQKYGASNAFANPNAPKGPGSAPNQDDYTKNFSQQQIRDYITQNAHYAGGNGNANYANFGLPQAQLAQQKLGQLGGFYNNLQFNVNGNPNATASMGNIYSDPNIQQYAAHQLAQNDPGYIAAQQQYQQQQQQYQQQMGNYNNYNQAYGALQSNLNNINPQSLQTALAYQQGLFGPVQRI